MTAEVIALNKSAAAMAADSKATVRINGVVKTHDTVNKLFTLSKYHPVGVMIYGNAEVLGVPWETVIKVYRDKLRSKCFSRLNSYANDFIASLIADYQSQIRSSESANVFWLAADFINSIVDQAEIVSRQYPDENIEELFESSLADFESSLEAARILHGFKKISHQDILSMHKDTVGQAFRRTVSDQLHPKFEERVVLAVCKALRREVFSEGRSGVVFAGFGDLEIFPSSKAFEVDGCVAGQIRAVVSHKQVINNEITATIKPFAQREMVARFMEGIDPGYRHYLERAFLGVSKEIAESIVDTFVNGSRSKKASIKMEVSKIVETQIAEFSKQSKLYRTSRFVDPITSMAELLPKEELGHLAESFVNLTSLKRRVSLDDESVGGPIDVAVISKGDGFVWLKRKHYFDQSLNGTFAANYFRSHVQAEGETGRERIRKTNI